ncbi:MAG: LysR family transcriptional regulator [Streptosporangiaceae bacterium]
MDLRLLGYFVAVAEEGHFGRAATRLHIAQPALSQQIRVLERDVGVRLFDRTTRRVDLTEPGRMLLDDARRLLRQADEVAGRMRRVAAGETGLLRAGFVNSAAFGILPRILRPFRASRPHVGLELHEMTTAVQLQALREGHLDVGIGRDAPPADIHAAGATAVELLHEPLVVALPAQHPLASRGPLTAADLAGEAFIVLPQSRVPGLYGAIAALCEAAGFDLRPALTALQFTTALGLAAAGMGIAVVPESTQAFRPAGLTYRPLTDPAATSTLQLIIRSAARSPALDHFTELAGRHARDATDKAGSQSPHAGTKP